MRYLNVWNCLWRGLRPLINILPGETGRYLLIWIIKAFAAYENYWLNVYVARLWRGDSFSVVMRQCCSSIWSPDTVPSQVEQYYHTVFAAAASDQKTH